MCRPYGRVFGPKFSKQGTLFRQICHKHGLVILKLAKNDQKWTVFRQKFIIKSGHESKFRQLEEGTFLKTGGQTSVPPQVMYPPPPGDMAWEQEKRRSVTTE